MLTSRETIQKHLTGGLEKKRHDVDRIKDVRDKVRKTLSEYRMIRTGDKVVVAVSGGPDSVCLIHILNELKGEFQIELAVAHFDHGLRPEQDKSETLFVKALAEKLGLPFDTSKAGDALSNKDNSLEERARDERYKFLELTRAGRSAQKIALGHNLNDQAETVLMRLLRGSGPAGLAGIPPVRDGVIIRPLIEITRQEIEEYLLVRGIESATDPSNRDTRFLRNRIRHRLLPLLTTFQPRIVEILGNSSRIIREDDLFMESIAEKWVKENSTEKSRTILFPLAPYRDLAGALQRRIARSCLKRLCSGNLRRIDSAHLESVRRMALGQRPQAALSLPKGITVSRVYDTILFRSNMDEADQGLQVVIDGEGTFSIGSEGWSLSIKEVEKADYSPSGQRDDVEYIDGDLIRFPLLLRNIRPGDRIIPLGMKGRKKIKDLFIDLKIPSLKRSRTPVLFSKDRAVWVCGIRLDDRFKVTSGTKKVFKLRYGGPCHKD